MSSSSNQDRHMIEVALRERMAALEASNTFHERTLREIGMSLNEVVKTQHLLANQREDIVKLVEEVREIKIQANDFNNYKDLSKFKLESVESSISDLKREQTSIAKKVEKNTSFISTLVKVGGIILAPLIAAVIHSYFGG